MITAVFFRFIYGVTLRVIPAVSNTGRGFFLWQYNKTSQSHVIRSHVTSALGQYNKSQSHVIISHVTSALGQYNRSQSHVISHVTSALGQYNKSQSNVISQVHLHIWHLILSSHQTTTSYLFIYTLIYINN